MIKSILREPLLHFIVLAGILFVIWSIRHPEAAPTEPSKPTIVVSEARIDSLIDIFTKVRQRPPTGQELRGLIDDYQQEEILYREALAMRLDEDDTIVRRRLRQKMELFIEDITSAAQPSEIQLEEFLQANADQFRVDRKIALRQIYLDPGKHPGTFEQDVAELKSKLNEESDPHEFGDSFLLPAVFELLPISHFTQTFGGEFGDQIFALNTCQWQGPVASSYGAYLVYVVAKQEGRLPPLEEIRSVVELEWFAKKRTNAKLEFYERLRENFQIVIESPKEVPAETESAL